MVGLINSNLQLGDSPAESQNFLLSVPSPPDGTVKLARGNFGVTTQDVLTVDAVGVVRIPYDVTVVGNATISGNLTTSGLVGTFTNGATATTQALSNNSTYISTTAYVDASNWPVQTWKNVTASRALSTAYYNTTAYPMQVAVRMSWSSGPGANSAYLVVSGAVISYFKMSAYSFYFTLVANVPPGAGYYVVNESYSAINSWFELN